MICPFHRAIRITAYILKGSVPCINYSLYNLSAWEKAVGFGYRTLPKINQSIKSTSTWKTVYRVAEDQVWPVLVNRKYIRVNNTQIGNWNDSEIGWLRIRKLDLQRAGPMRCLPESAAELN